MEFGRILKRCVSLNILFGILTSFMAAGNAYAQDSINEEKTTIAIYITVKFSKKCENQVVNFDNKKFCLATQPVLTVSDLSHVSSIKIDLANQSYFSLVFKEAGVKKLQNLSVAFPNTEIVLVVDRLIVGFLTDLETLKSNSLKMTAGGGSTQNVEFVHEKMKTVLPVKN